MLFVFNFYTCGMHLHAYLIWSMIAIIIQLSLSHCYHHSDSSIWLTSLPIYMLLLPVEYPRMINHSHFALQLQRFSDLRISLCSWFSSSLVTHTCSPKNVSSCCSRSINVLSSPTLVSSPMKCFCPVEWHLSLTW